MKRTLLALAALLMAAANAAGQNFRAGNLDIKAACYNRVDSSIVYDPSYRTIGYPMGDVPANVGVCTDAVIRVLRDCHIDLQEKMNIAIKSDNRDNGGRRYHIKKPNTSIDHRRVWNLKKMFDNWAGYTGEGTCCSFIVHGIPTEGMYGEGFYPPGTMVIYEMWPGQGHIGIVIDSEQNLIFHQVGYGQVIDASLHSWKIVGAYLIDQMTTENLAYEYGRSQKKAEVLTSAFSVRKRREP